MTPKDLLGQEMTVAERELLEVYGQLRSLLDREDLPPIAEASVKEAVAVLWQAVHGLALDDDRPEV